MFSFKGSPVPVRDDLRDAHKAIWAHFARPGQVFDAGQRRAILDVARNNAPTNGDAIGQLAAALYTSPAAVTRDMVRSAIDASGEPATVEAVSLVSMLAAVDSTHRALGAELEPLPEPLPGDPSGTVAEGLKKRRTYVPMPRNSITVALELLPVENEAYAAACGPHYMTFAEMASPLFERSPGLDRAQLETIASRTSLFQECFY
ncbi:MAG: hypothetical protein ABFR53_03365 [Actinomycetota bacterium]